MGKRRRDKADDGRKPGAGLALGKRWKSIDFTNQAGNRVYRLPETRTDDVASPEPLD